MEGFSHSPRRVRPVLSFERCRERIAEQIGLEALVREQPERAGLYREIARIMADVMVRGPGSLILIDGEELTAEAVQDAYKVLDDARVEAAADRFLSSPVQIRRPKAWFRTALYNMALEFEAGVASAADHRASW